MPKSPLERASISCSDLMLRGGGGGGGTCRAARDVGADRATRLGYSRLSDFPALAAPNNRKRRLRLSLTRGHTASLSF
jgi:hypothetical protein